VIVTGTVTRVLLSEDFVVSLESLLVLAEQLLHECRLHPHDGGLFVDFLFGGAVFLQCRYAELCDCLRTMLEVWWE
jgi:hypothetical protein